MLKIKDITFLIFLLFLFSTLYAQQDYKKWLKEEQKKFQEFKDARDKAFVEFLKKEWQAFELFKGLVPDETPKPVNIPVTTNKRNSSRYPVQKNQRNTASQAANNKGVGVY